MRRSVCVRREGWVSNGDVTVKGTAFRGDDYYDTPALAHLIAATQTNELHRLFTELNGFFAVISERPETTLIAVDRQRSIPLFYATVAGTHYVSDDARWIHDQLSNPTRDPLAEAEFCLLGFVTGRDTRYAEIKQVQAGELVRFTGPRVGTGRYFRFNHWPDANGAAAPSATLDDVLVASFERLVTLAAGRQLVVPLDGETDSLLVACMLRRLGYDNVVTVSYGRRGTRTVRLGERIAAALDLPWVFVEYTPDQWRTWYADPAFRDYLHGSHDYCVEPAVAVWPAVKTLVEEYHIAPDAVVVTGDGIVTAGRGSDGDTGPIDPTAHLDSTEIASHIVHSQYQRWNWVEPAVFEQAVERVDSRLRTLETDPLTAPAADVFGEWHWQERLSKTTRGDVFAWFDLDWWCPLFDAALVEYWRRLPLDQRGDAAFYTEYVEALFTGLTGMKPPALRRIGRLARGARAVVRTAEGTPAENFVARLRARRAYAKDPLAMLALVPRPVYDALAPNATDVHTYIVLDLLGRLPTEPDTEHPAVTETSIPELAAPVTGLTVD